MSKQAIVPSGYLADFVHGHPQGALEAIISSRAVAGLWHQVVTEREHA